MLRVLRGLFPGLRECPYQLTSPFDENYNCIAWAAGDVTNWWWPTAGSKPNYWPEAVPADETIPAFVEAFASLGYTECEGGGYEPGFEKVALYADQDGIPTHMARQLPDGTWTSKIGELPDIQHGTLEALEGMGGEGEASYGWVVKFLRRPTVE